MAEEDEERERVLGLLRSQHSFPGPYLFRVVIRPEDRERITAIVEGALPDGASLEVTEQPSRHGAYVSLRCHTELPDAEAVVAVYDALRGIEGVLAVM